MAGAQSPGTFPGHAPRPASLTATVVTRSNCRPVAFLAAVTPIAEYERLSAAMDSGAAERRSFIPALVS
jgi:hypothetical protein